MHRAPLAIVLSLLAASGDYGDGKTILRNVNGFRVAAEQRGAGGRLSGDFHIITERSWGRIGVVIGDACGKGAEGHAQMARVMPRARELALSGVTPARLLAELNRTVIAELPLDRFVTVAALELDLRAGVLTVANAAHVPALVRRAGRVTIVGHASGAPLGFSAMTTYVDERHSLLPGDVIVLMTDGVLEAVEANLATMSTLTGSLTDTAFGVAGVHRLLLRMFERGAVGRHADDMTLLALEPLDSPRASKARTALPANSCALLH
jgi:serine phosphatase RsbU (regulator of sigma subunit)